MPRFKGTCKTLEWNVHYFETEEEIDKAIKEHRFWTGHEIEKEILPENLPPCFNQLPRPNVPDQN